MKSAVVVDSSCDLPQSFIDQNPVTVLPLSFSIDGKIRVDDLKESDKVQMYRTHLIERDHNVESLPTSPQDVVSFFLERIVTQYDFVIGQTVAQTRSPNYGNWLQASGEIQKDYHGPRKEAGREGPFTFRIINTGTFFSGQGLIAAYTIHQLKQGTTRNQIRMDLENFKTRVVGLTVPKDVAYLRERARKKGDKSVGLMSSMVGKALDIYPILRGDNDRTEPVAKVKGRENAVNKLFDHIAASIKSGLHFPVVNISVADDPVTLKDFAGFNRLLEVAREHNVRVITCVMGMAGGINLGPGAISTAFAPGSETTFKAI